MLKDDDRPEALKLAAKQAREAFKPFDGVLTANANKRQVGGVHYKKGIEHWDYVVANSIPYLEAQVIKYVSRWRDKNGLEDLRKAQHFLEKLIEHEERTKNGEQLRGVYLLTSAADESEDEADPDHRYVNQG